MSIFRFAHNRSDATYTCGFCASNFATAVNFRKHLMSIHGVTAEDAQEKQKTPNPAYLMQLVERLFGDYGDPGLPARLAKLTADPHYGNLHVMGTHLASLMQKAGHLYQGKLTIPGRYYWTCSLCPQTKASPSRMRQHL